MTWVESKHINSQNHFTAFKLLILHLLSIKSSILLRGVNLLNLRLIAIVGLCRHLVINKMSDLLLWETVFASSRKTFEIESCV